MNRNVMDVSAEHVIRTVEHAHTGCLFGFHGDNCEEICPSVYMADVNRSSGECTECCHPGLHGRRCEQLCPKCALGVCDQLTGSCLGNLPSRISWKFCHR